LTEFRDGVEECDGKCFNPEINRGEEAVVHEDEVPTMGT
jgi:hypothetical protein